MEWKRRRLIVTGLVAILCVGGGGVVWWYLGDDPVRGLPPPPQFPGAQIISFTCNQRDVRNTELTVPPRAPLRIEARLGALDATGEPILESGFGLFYAVDDRDVIHQNSTLNATRQGSDLVLVGETTAPVRPGAYRVRIVAHWPSKPPDQNSATLCEGQLLVSP